MLQFKDAFDFGGDPVWQYHADHYYCWLGFGLLWEIQQVAFKMPGEKTKPGDGQGVAVGIAMACARGVLCSTFMCVECGEDSAKARCGSVQGED